MKCAGFLLPILEIFTEFTFSSELIEAANIFSGAIGHGNEISVNKRVHERITSDEIEADTNLLICIKLRQIEYYF